MRFLPRAKPVDCGCFHTSRFAALDANIAALADDLDSLNRAEAVTVHLEMITSKREKLLETRLETLERQMALIIDHANAVKRPKAKAKPKKARKRRYG